MSSEEAEWGPNPDLYARMAEPYPTPADAENALRRFIDGVATLREECRIPEALIIVAAYYAPQEGNANNVACRSLGMGNPACHATMAAELFNQHAAPVLEHANRIQRTATRRRKR